MRITATAVAQDRIDFVSRCGEGTTRWTGTRPPTISAVYDVEFDLEILLETSMISADSRPPGFSRSGAETLVRGVLEAVDEDRMGCLRIAPDCIIQVETRVDPSSVGKAFTLRLTPSQWRVTPVAD